MNRPPSSERNLMAAAPHFSRLNTSAAPNHSSGESRVLLLLGDGGVPVPSSLLLTHQAGAPTPVAHGRGGLAVHRSNNTYTAAPPAYDSAPQGAATSNNWLPQDGGFGTSFAIQANAYAADVGPWQHLAQHALPNQQQQAQFHVYPEALPPRSQNARTPDIRVITAVPNNSDYQPQPQDLNYSATSVSSAASTLPPQDPFFSTSYNAHLGVHNPHFMPAEQQEKMQTPPHSPHHTITGDQNPRKRSYSDISGGAVGHPASAGGSRSGSVMSHGEHSMGEDYSPRNRAFKREDPPMNADNKYVCTFAPDCAALVFDRKCEWR